MSIVLPESSRREPADKNGVAQSGTTLLETLAVLAIAGLLVSLTLPSMLGAYRRQQLSSTSSSVRGIVQHTRLKALKEKIDHRILIHDEDAITPNRIDVEELQAGTYVAIDDLSYQLPEEVKILGSAPMDSLDTTEVTRRGHCNSGSLYLQDLEGNMRVVEIKTSCFSGVQ